MGSAADAKVIRKMVSTAVSDGRILKDDIDDRAQQYLCAIPLEVGRVSSAPSDATLSHRSPYPQFAPLLAPLDRWRGGQSRSLLP